MNINKLVDKISERFYRRYKTWAFDFLDRVSYQNDELILDHAPATRHGEEYEPIKNAFLDFVNNREDYLSDVYDDHFEEGDFTFDEFKNAIVNKMYELLSNDFNQLNESTNIKEKQMKFKEEDLVPNKDTILNSDNMEGDAEEVLSQLPDSGIEGKHDVDELAESMKDAFWKAYVTAGTKYEEAFNIKNFITDFLSKNSDADLNSIAAALPNTGTGKYYKNHPDLLAQKIAQASGKSTEEVSAPPAFDPNSLTNDLAKELATIPEEDTIISAADSAQDKFDTLRSVARTILQGKGIKHHAFIYGDAGVGKCASYEEKIPVKMDDKGAEAFKKWLQISKSPFEFKTKEMDIEVGALYDFISVQGGTIFKENGGEFLEVPFDLQIKDENGKWISSSMVYRKEDAIYEVEFEKDGKKKVGRYAAKHIVAYDIAHKISSYVKDLQVNDELPNGFVVKSVKKIKDKDYVYSPQADSETHLFQDVDGMIHHNTYAVKEAMKYDFPKGNLSRKGFTIEFNSGDIGRSASAIVAFFYKNRANKIIVLDDCDSFVLAKDQAIQNLLKGMLDLDNTDKNPKYITVAPQIRKLASKIIGADEKYDEGVEISIDQQKLKENILNVSIDGEEVLNESISDDEKALFSLKESKTVQKKVKESGIDYFGLGLLEESDEELDEDDLLTQEEFSELERDLDEDGIPPKWRFTSRLIMISNLHKSDLNEAVLSRTLSYELSLTQDEFIARLGSILPNMLTDVETEDSTEVVQYAKNVAYAYLMAAVDLNKNNGTVAGKPVRIVGKLQFRIIAELAGKWMQRADDYAVKNNISGTDKKTLNMINNAIKRNFFVFDVLPSLIID